ncbi:hypothetical protein SUGI_0441400 [Cryptomeria japonica]|uniref:uncharacterized protein LOC131032122 n=1 Tax=Cryptomeria japonica TaxID=3369 RepID=UPI002408B696|nr:uncharacterized protein LOC131032122 [Cryptomeria japonica]GLJ23330.1 hypothetical protein SUGI_0441400 [Cryptomeria japonica]
MAEGLNVKCFLVAVVLFLPSLANGLRPAFMAAEMQQNIIKNAEAQPSEQLHSERKLQGSMEFYQQQVRPEKLNAPPLMSRESARMVPTGPDPLHHNGGPIKPKFP